MSILVIRADATREVGTGHVMRTFGLAQVWRSSGCRAIFCGRCDSEVIRTRLASEGFDYRADIMDTSALVSLARDLMEKTDIFMPWILVDGYHFDTDYLDSLGRSPFPVLVLDDMAHLDHYTCTRLVNQNVYASKDMYPQVPSERLLLGARYAILRHEFRRLALRTREPNVVPKLLVTIGGTDPGNATAVVLDALRHLGTDAPPATIVIGAGNPHRDMLYHKAATLKSSCQVIDATDDMAILLSEVDMAVAAAGTTTWELAYMRVPSILVATVENQRRVASSMADQGAAIEACKNGHLDSVELAKQIRRLSEDRPLRARLGRKCGGLVDGLGAKRICRSLLETQIRLDIAVERDIRQIYEWANEPAVRAVSHHPDPIPWEDHVRWFADKLCKQDCRIVFARSDTGIPLGQVRFDRTEKRATVSVIVDRAIRGRMIGGALLRLACARAFESDNCLKTLEASILSGNQPSINTFESAGFVRIEETKQAGKEWIRYERIRPAA